MDVGIARGPEVFEQRLSESFGERSGAIAQEVESFAQRPAPLLVPAGLAAVAAAVGAPALYAMRAAPGAVVDDFTFPLRRKPGEELAVVGEARLSALFNPVHGVAEG